MDSRTNDQKQRSITATHLLDELIKNTKIPEFLNDTTSEDCRDRCLDVLMQARASRHYKNISQKLADGKTLLDSELLYYVVSVDDVNKLDEKIFEQLKTIEKELRYSSRWWQSTISVLLRAHEWKTEQDPVAKKQLNEALYYNLRARGSYRNHDVGYYLNMRGFNFEGIDLTSTSLDFMDLENANFSRAIMHNATIRLSNISHAKFNEITAVRGKNQKNYDHDLFSISDTIAKNSSFDEANLSEPYFNRTDFSGSTFKGANIEAATFKNVILDDSDLSHCTLSMTCSYTQNNFSMKNANLTDAVLHSFTLSDAKMTGAKLLPDDAFLNINNLNSELDKAQQLLEKFTHGGSDAYKESQKEHFKKIIADNVVAGTSELTNDNALKQALIDTAVAHPMFQPESVASKFLFSVSNGLYAAQCTLFGKANQQHIYHPTTALQILEEASERIIPTIYDF